MPEPHSRFDELTSLAFKAFSDHDLVSFEGAMSALADDISDLEEQHEALVRRLGERNSDYEKALIAAAQQKDRAIRAEEQFEFAREMLAKIATAQDRALGYIEANGFVFDDIGKEPGNWKHLAFSLYSDLCEVDTWAHAGLALPLGETPDATQPSDSVSSPRSS